jgi:DUF971 family protein
MTAKQSLKHRSKKMLCILFDKISSGSTYGGTYLPRLAQTRDTMWIERKRTLARR